VRRFSTGLPELDEALGGGAETGKLMLIYGDEKSGKTSLVLRMCASAAKSYGGAAYVDCSGRLHPERVLQILKANKVDPERVSVLIVENFLQQEEVILRLHDGAPPAPFVALDDFTYQHRVELSGNVRGNLGVYKRLAFQIAALKEAAARNNLAVVVVGHVHELPETGETRLVAQRILTYWSDVVVRIVRPPGERVSQAYVEKPLKKGPIGFEVVSGGVAPWSKKS